MFPSFYLILPEDDSAEPKFVEYVVRNNVLYIRTLTISTFS